MADITQELIVIASEPKGRLVKDAIHDALEKVNQDEPETRIVYPQNAIMIVEHVPFISILEIEEGTVETDMMCAFWEQGGGNTDTGEFNTTHTTRIRDPEHIRLPLSNGGSRSIRFDAESGNTKLDYIPYFYANGSYIVPEASAWHTYDEDVAIPANATTTRFVVRFSDDRVIVPLDLTSCTAYITT